MDQISDKKLNKVFKALRVRPDKAFYESTLRKLWEVFNENVTAESDLRNQGKKQFNLLFFFNMQAKYRVLIYLAVSVLVGLALGGVTVYAANNSAPGDFLFGLDKAIENLERGTISAPDQKLAYELARLQERLQELDMTNKISEYEDQYEVIIELENKLGDDLGKYQKLQNDALYQELLNQLLLLKQQKENAVDEQTKQQLETMIEQLKDRLEVRKEQLAGDKDIEEPKILEPSKVKDQNQEGPDDKTLPDNGINDDSTDDNKDDNPDDSGSESDEDNNDDSPDTLEPTENEEEGDGA